MRSILPSEFLNALRQITDLNNLLTDPAECWAYGYDNSRKQVAPIAVVFATSTEQIQRIVKLCNQYQTPLTVRGRGTGTAGGAVPVMGGIVLSCERMDKIIEFDPANRMITVEPGVLNQTVQDIAAKQGFFWPPDPSSASFCTVGGNLAYNTAGPRAVKYGTPRENTLRLTAITGVGEIITTGTYTTKGVVGYDLTRLLIGSEGTLAIITEATLKLTPLPETKQTIRAVYTDIYTATEAIANIMAQSAIPCALEFMDSKALELIRQQGVILPVAAKALLLIDVDGLTTNIAEVSSKIVKAATNAGLLESMIATDTSAAKDLWQARKALSPALRTLAPGKINEDVVVPVSKIPELISYLEQLAEKYQLIIVNFGHAGNGNIHVNLLFNPADPKQQQNAKLCLEAVFDKVLALGGTLSGEHGIGTEKREFIDREIDKNSLALMRQIKTAFDPNNILNPGKIFPEHTYHVHL